MLVFWARELYETRRPPFLSTIKHILRCLTTWSDRSPDIPQKYLSRHQLVIDSRDTIEINHI